MVGLGKELRYPRSTKWVVFSCILIAISVFYAVLFLTDPFSIFLFFIFTSFVTVIFSSLKFWLYLKAQEEFEEQKEEVSRRYILFLILILALFLFMPFYLVVFLEPLSWFIFIDGFVAGVNIPEVILYLYSRYKFKVREKHVKT